MVVAPGVALVGAPGWLGWLEYGGGLLKRGEESPGVFSGGGALADELGWLPEPLGEGLVDPGPVPGGVGGSLGSTGVDRVILVGDGRIDQVGALV